MEENNKEMESQDIEKETFVDETQPDSTTDASSENAGSESDNVSETEKTDADKIAELEEKCQNLHNDYLRLYADFDNYRKRMLKEKSDLIKTAGENILVNILPLVDDFERAQKAMESASDMEAIREGVNLIYDKFKSFLSQNGVNEIDAMGKPFDLDFHEAIVTIPAPSEDMKGKVVDCTQKGYTLHEKVIRYSKVVVGE